MNQRTRSVVCLVVLFVISSTAFSVLAQSITPVPTSQPTGAPSTSSTVVPLPSSTLSYSEVLGLYGNFSTEIAKSSQNTIELAKWVFASLLGLSGVTIAVIAFIANQVRGANQASNRSAQAAQTASDEAERSRKRLEELQSQITASTQEAELIRKTLGELQNQIALSTEELSKSKHAVTLIRREFSATLPTTLKQIETVASIEQLKLALYSPEEVARTLAVLALIELSKDEDAVVRSVTIDAFRSSTANAISADDRELLVDRLRDISKNDSEPALRSKAEIVLGTLRQQEA